MLTLVRCLVYFHSLYVNFFLFLILHDKIYRNITMPDHAEISGYTLEGVAKMLKAVDSRPVKGSWRKHRKMEELEYYQCEIT